MKLPLLDLVETREERNGNEDDDGFLAVTDFNLHDSRVSRSTDSERLPKV